jgi:hypothetical protein
MKFASAFSIALLTAVRLAGAAEPWTPPENPDPQKILHEARADARAKNYETALAKHVWYHENALKFQESQSAVRRSFALSHWLDLADDYPPALDELKAIRDETARRVAPEKGKRIKTEDFADLAAINRTLDDESATVQVFRELDAHDAKLARRVYRYAERALVESKEYALCGRYIDSDREIFLMIQGFQTTRELEQKPRAGRKLPEFAEKNFINEGALLVALLVVNDRKTEAENVVRELKKETGDAAFHEKLAKALDESMKGVVPEPWP